MVVLPALERSHRHPSPDGAVGPRREAPAIAAAGLADGGQQPIDRGAAHGQQRFPHRRFQLQVSVTLQGFHQQWQQRMQSLAAEPITGLPQRHQGCGESGEEPYRRSTFQLVSWPCFPAARKVNPQRSSEAPRVLGPTRIGNLWRDKA